MKFLEQVDLVARRLRLSPKTISAYSVWICQYLTFCSARLGTWTHPAKLGTSDCEAFLNDLVVHHRLSASSPEVRDRLWEFGIRHSVKPLTAWIFVVPIASAG